MHGWVGYWAEDHSSRSKEQLFAVVISSVVVLGKWIILCFEEPISFITWSPGTDRHTNKLRDK